VLNTLLLAILVLFPLVPVMAGGKQFPCKGLGTYKYRQCTSERLRHSTEQLGVQLPADLVGKWKKTIQDACAAAYSGLVGSTLYVPITTGCADRMNRSLLQEFQGWED
jgi:hypothetical protein